MSNFSKIFAGICLSMTFTHSAFAATVHCTVWETMWSTNSGKPEVVKNLELVGEEETKSAGLKNNLTLGIERYSDQIYMVHPSLRESA